MSSNFIKKSVWAAIVLAGVATIIMMALPFIASTHVVRDRIAVEMSAWSGYRVTLGEAPEIEIWPLRAILRNVRFSGWNDPERKPVIVVEQVVIELSAVAALRGDVVFSTTRLIGPILHLSSTGNEMLNPLSPDVGRIARAISVVRNALNDNAEVPDLSRISGDPFGKLEFVDGRVVIHNNNDNDEEIISDIGGALNWSAFDRNGSFAATGTWRGESMVLNVVMDKPLLLFAGGTAPFSLSLQGNPVDLTFEGSANFSRQPHFKGNLSFSTPALADMLEWMTRQPVPELAFRSIAISGTVNADSQRIRYEDSKLTLDGKPGKGALDLSFNGGPPTLSGTLAFDTLDVRSMLAAFAPLYTRDDAAGIVLTDYFDLDLRLSATTANIDLMMLANVAATVQIRPGLATFDISDASVFGGTIQTGIRFDRQPGANPVELRLLANDLDGSLLARFGNQMKFIPTSRCTISLILKGEGKSFGELLQNGDGSLSASFSQGNIPELDLNVLLQQMKHGGFFPLADASKGTMPIHSADIKATIANGAAHINKAEINAQAHTIILSGIVPYIDGGLALSGLIYPRAAEDAEPAAAEAIFFVGGSWRDPYIAPMNPNTPEPDAE